MDKSIQDKMRRLAAILRRRIAYFSTLPLHSTYSMERSLRKLEQYQTAADAVCAVYYKSAYMTLRAHRSKFPGRLSNEGNYGQR